MMRDLSAMLRAGSLRIVCPRRKRTLRKRGVRVWWEPELSAYVWERLA